MCSLTTSPAGAGLRHVVRAIIIMDDTMAAEGIRQLLVARYPVLTVLCCSSQMAMRLPDLQLPDSLIITLVDTRPPLLLPQLRQLFRLRAHARHTPWLLLSHGEHQALRVLLPGVQVLPMNTPLVSLQKVFDRMINLSGGHPATDRLWPLTARQWEVLCLLAQGLRPREVARRLGIAEKTVSSHRTSLLLRLGLSRHHEWLLFCAVAVTQASGLPSLPLSPAYHPDASDSVVSRAAIA
ncbi:TPA: response regulator transcription factor [Klebsiella aerogenes]|nr:response regulator transcription factor [Klebsiella aerogenes]